ncbi:MAG TPA: RNA polymerase sigma factor [Hymenobacter sp.]|uniref:RNA polymerase sigma factor n=1 Tax=Hymenobacter sp. TaxID=1898978 RepID=UPI002D7F4CD9|nr:RNA polymerase sigma factor [Hymenobacter sp.]HET9504346.1 RNA polymerase sigma factor [Hymenobacter sp.]
MSAPPASPEVLQALLAGCRRGDRAMQQRLYGLYYSYALGICLRYTRQRNEAEEVVNDGFLKTFRDLGRFDAERYELSSSFRGWLRKIMIRTAIDYFRAHEKHHRQDDLADLLHEPTDAGWHTREEIAQHLGITADTSKSNLSKARAHLRLHLKKTNPHAYAVYAG